MATPTLSVLDVCPVPSGQTSAQALKNTLDLAPFVEKLGYHRYWLAEHHNFPGIASSAPEIIIGHVADVTRTLRVGAGGIMLPNHSPLKVAEMFRVLEALHPGRIDLGLGRAPGTDALTAMALRRSTEVTLKDEFPGQLGDLLCYFSGSFPDNHPFRKVKAVPTDVATPELWLLSSSGYSASMAAELGLGFSFAHHINAEPAVEALRLYHELFKPTPAQPEPLSMLTVLAICAETNEEAERLARPMDLTRLRMEQGIRRVYPSQQEADEYEYNALEKEIVRQNRLRMFVGSPAKIKSELMELVDRTGVKEVMILTITAGHEERKKSYELLAKAFL